jgi:hypothetical protein
MIDPNVEAIRRRIRAALQAGDPAQVRLWQDVLRDLNFEVVRKRAVEKEEDAVVTSITALHRRESAWR